MRPETGPAPPEGRIWREAGGGTMKDQTCINRADDNVGLGQQPHERGDVMRLHEVRFGERRHGDESIDLLQRYTWVMGDDAGGAW